MKKNQITITIRVDEVNCDIKLEGSCDLPTLFILQRQVLRAMVLVQGKIEEGMGIEIGTSESGVK